MRGCADRFSVGEVVILWLNSCWFGKYQLVCLCYCWVYTWLVCLCYCWLYLMSWATVVVVLDGSDVLWWCYWNDKLTNLSLPFCLEVPCLPCSSLYLDALKSCSWSDREMSWSWWFSELTQAGRSSWHQVRWCQLVSSPGTYLSQPWLWGQCDLFSMWIAFSSKVALKPDYTKMSFFPLLFDFVT